LAILLGVVALLGLRPWATSSVAPDLSVSPRVGAAVGDSAVVAQAGSPSAAGTGGIAAPRSTPTVAAPAPVSTSERHAAQPLLAVSAGRALTVSASSPVASPPVSEPAPAADPVAAAPAPAPETAPAPPVVASVPSAIPGTSGDPVTSGVGGPEPEQSCEGDEYLITVTFEEAEGEEAEADIVIRQIGADGSETEVQLRGDLNDVRSLIATLVAEGNCVHLEVGTTAEDGTPSGGTSPVVVPTEGVPSSVPARGSGEPAAPSSP
jgi:hypothetical protein